MTMTHPTIATPTTSAASSRPTTNDPAVERAIDGVLRRMARGSALVATLSTGAIFGFFYAWISSTLIGLDDADPRVAIEAMQAMNASVRNAIFFPVYFLTPVLLAIAAVMAGVVRSRRAAGWFTAAAVIYFFGGLMLTTTIHVPMNEELAEVVVPSSVETADAIWSDYSATWQFWNVVRTVFCGISLTMAGFGLIDLGRARKGR
jgi:uncharacterized membrane protein